MEDKKVDKREGFWTITRLGFKIQWNVYPMNTVLFHWGSEIDFMRTILSSNLTFKFNI